MVRILPLNLNKYHRPPPSENCLSTIINRAHGEWGAALNC